MLLRDDLLQIRSLGICFYALRDRQGIYLIDSGFIGGMRALRHSLRRHGWSDTPIRGIIVTHGHLDHILNVSRIATETGAWIAAPRLDTARYAGQAVHPGTGKIAASMETLGRRVLRYRPFTPTRLLDDGDTLDIWHGLTVVHLPGHTTGHSGLYCPTLKWLFCGDLFASYGMLAHLPPPMLNVDTAQAHRSTSRALRLELTGLLPHHADTATPAVHLQRLRRISQHLPFTEQ